MKELINKAIELKITNIRDVHAFLTLLQKDMNVIFHPDNEFSDYITPTGKPLFTKREAKKLEKQLATCFEVCNNQCIDLYEFCLEIDTGKYWWHSGSGRIEIQLSEECINQCSHMGDCYEDCRRWAQIPEVATELAKIDPQQLRIELSEMASCWDHELDNHQENLIKILWIACGDIQEQKF